jgi:hypothetical protein
MNNRAEKSYNGALMTKGKENEEIILEWLKNNYKDIIDFREFRLAQRIDVDFGIETIDGNIVLAEIKSDKYINEFGNLCFEYMRINHYVKDKWFYLGWGWRSPAKKLIVRNPNSSETFIFEFEDLRKKVALFISENGKKLEDLTVSNNKSFFQVIETDKQKTTFNFLMPMKCFKNIYKKFII